MTASGRPYSYKYGYGALDAWTFVELAKTWKLVKKQAWVDLPQIELNNAAITAEGVMTGGEFIVPGGVKSVVNVNKTYLAQNNFETLEHITNKVWIAHAKRGDVEDRIVLRDIEDVIDRPYGRPPKTIVKLGVESAFGRRLVFVPKAEGIGADLRHRVRIATSAAR